MFDKALGEYLKCCLGNPSDMVASQPWVIFSHTVGAKCAIIAGLFVPSAAIVALFVFASSPLAAQQQEIDITVCKFQSYTSNPGG